MWIRVRQFSKRSFTNCFIARSHDGLSVPLPTPLERWWSGWTNAQRLTGGERMDASSDEGGRSMLTSDGWASIGLPCPTCGEFRLIETIINGRTTITHEGDCRVPKVKPDAA
jgi:hypothetical protein